MVNIYCLVDPRNDYPFYVGATIKTIRERCMQHCCGLNKVINWRPQRFYPLDLKKKLLINEIFLAGFKTNVVLLAQVSDEVAHIYEAYFYNILNNQGYALFQYPVFCHYYANKPKSFIKLEKSNIQLFDNQYDNIYFKDLLIIIW